MNETLILNRETTDTTLRYFVHNTNLFIIIPVIISGKYVSITNRHEITYNWLTTYFHV